MIDNRGVKMKGSRQNLISEIITSRCIRTQEELASALQERGVSVTQATISRDIKEMHLVKGLAEDGTYRYILGEQGDSGVSDRLIRMLADSVVSMDSAANLIVVRTLSGSAHVAGEAIDSLKWPEIVGTIAGDNTILIIVRTEENVKEILQRFEGILG